MNISVRLTALSKSKFAVQVCQLALQGCNTLLEFCIFGCQGFWNFKIVATMAANRRIIADIFVTKGASHA